MLASIKSTNRPEFTEKNTHQHTTNQYRVLARHNQKDNVLSRGSGEREMSRITDNTVPFSFRIHKMQVKLVGNLNVRLQNVNSSKSSLYLSCQINILNGISYTATTSK